MLKNLLFWLANLFCSLALRCLIASTSYADKFELLAGTSGMLYGSTLGLELEGSTF